MILISARLVKFINLRDKASVKVVRVEKDFMGMGPAVKIKIQKTGGNMPLWIFEAIDRIKMANPGLLAKERIFDPDAFAPYSFSVS